MVHKRIMIMASKDIFKRTFVFLLVFVFVTVSATSPVFAISARQKDLMSQNIIYYDPSCDPNAENIYQPTTPSVNNFDNASVTYKNTTVGNIPPGGKEYIASVYGTTGEKDSNGKYVEYLGGIEGGSNDERGKPLKGRAVVAEMRSNTALGGLPYGTKIEITYKGRSVIAEVSDNGPGAGDPSDVDLWREVADLLKFPYGKEKVTIRAVADDTPLTPVGGDIIENAQNNDMGNMSASCCAEGSSNQPVSIVGGDDAADGMDMYSSGLDPNGPFILEQWAIHVLKAVAQIKGISENNTVTKNHVVALLAFALGEGGDINNPQKFNPLNLGSWAAYVDGASAANGVQSFKSFDAGVTPVAKQFLMGTQSRLGDVLIKPNSSAADFMKALTYFNQYPGNALWAEASVPDPDKYYRERLDLIKTVVNDYANIASITIGTPGFKDQPNGSRKPDLLQFSDGAGVNVDELPAGDNGGTNCEPPPCPPGLEGMTIEYAKPEDWVNMYSGSNKAKAESISKGKLNNPKALIIHYTTGDESGQSLLDYFAGEQGPGGRKVGIQFAVDKSGKIFQYYPLDDMRVTYHAVNINHRSIGIEIIGKDGRMLLDNQKQFESVVKLASFLCDKYSIPCGDPKGNITNSSAEESQGMLGHAEVPGNEGNRTDPDGYTGSGYDAFDSKTHEYMIKLRTAMGFNPTPNATSEGADNPAVGCEGATVLTEDEKKIIGEGENQALAIQAIKYDHAKNPKYKYVSGGGHGPLSQLKAFDKDGTGGMDCSGFIRFIIWKVYGYDIGSIVTGGFPSSQYFKEVSAQEVQAGDIGWRSGHVDFITKNFGGGKLYQFGAHTAQNGKHIYGGETTADRYTKFFRYIGPKK